MEALSASNMTYSWRRFLHQRYCHHLRCWVVLLSSSLSSDYILQDISRHRDHLVYDHHHRQQIYFTSSRHITYLLVNRWTLLHPDISEKRCLTWKICLTQRNSTNNFNSRAILLMEALSVSTNTRAISLWRRFQFHLSLKTHCEKWTLITT